MSDDGEEKLDVIAKKLDVVVRREAEEEPDSIFLLAKGLGILGFLAGYMTMCGRGTPTHPVFGAAAFIISMLAAWFSTKAPPRPMKLTSRNLAVKITPEEIAFDGKTIARSKIVSTLYNHPSLRCLDEGGRILFEALIPDEAEATDLVSLLGGTRHRTSYLTASPTGMTPNRRLASIFGGYGLIGAVFMFAPKMSAPLFVPLAIALFILPRVLMSLAGRIEVGADGLLLRWAGLKRFIAYDQIERVEASGSFVRIACKGQRSATVYPLSDAVGLEALIARIEAARRARLLPAPRAELETRLARGERTIRDWRRDLAKIDDHDGYREAALPRDELWRIVEDASAPEDARAGAALVLRRLDDAPRLRVAADAVASPKLRVALETAADLEIDDAELDEKLKALP